MVQIEPKSPPADCKILVADDSVDDRFCLSDAFAEYPSLQLVHELEDGIETIYYLNGDGKYADRRRFPVPDVLLLDLKMPCINGLQVLQWIKTQGPNGIRVIAMTGSKTEADLSEAVALGASHSYVKPPEFHEFAHHLARSLVTGPSEDPQV